jgi:hypothetical protein
MQPVCVYCGSNDNLNTQLTITLEDGTKATVNVCDEHAEDASVKTARAAYMEKQKQIEQFLEQAKALGIEIPSQPTGGGLILPKQAPAPAPAVPAAPAPQESIKIVDKKEAEEGWVPSAKVDSAKGMRSVGGNAGGHAVSGHNSYTVSGQQDVLDEGVRRGKVKMGLAEGRAGAPIVLPEKRVDGTGTTRIRIVHNESDNTLQRRFKDMANDSKSDQQPDFRNGYEDTTRPCPICRGECVVDGQDCPKCDGLGTINV